MTIRIILADDHAIFRQALAPLLEAERGITLLAQAADGREAWRLIKSLRPDVAVLDVSMPLITGIEIAQRVEDACLDTRVLLLTMHDALFTVLQATEVAAAGYVLKDNSFEELVLAVHTIAAGGTFITPSIRAKLRELQRNGRATTALSPREREVVRLVALGNSSKQIARVMNISPRTVDTYRNRLMEKLGLRGLAEIVRYALLAGIIA